MVPNGPSHDEDLWRWILGGDVGADVTDQSGIVRRRLELATRGYDLFARSQKLGSVLTVEAWEPPTGSGKSFEVIIYRRDTGELIDKDKLPVDEQMKEQLLEYVRRFDGV